MNRVLSIILSVTGAVVIALTIVVLVLAYYAQDGVIFARGLAALGMSITILIFARANVWSRLDHAEEHEA